jgi:predicted alpha/beta hydrolase family esterase
MDKRVFIVHGWDGYPEEGWFPWLKKELEEKGFQVFVPQLPEAGSPRIHNWVPKLAEVVGDADKNTYFIGHSMGCQTIVRYLEELPEDVEVGGAVFVAGFFKRLTGLEDEEDVRWTDEHWLSKCPDLEKVRLKMARSIAIFSDNDPYVPLDNQDDFKDRLGSEIIIKNNMGHFNKDAGVTELPIALKSLLDIAS